ncbi:MAG: hypothetical protein V8Q54_06535, partial [Alistipes senegalensis]
MNRFLRRIFWFVLPVAAAAAGAEWGLRSIPHQLGYKAAYMERHAPEIEVLSLGALARLIRTPFPRLEVPG